MAVSIHVRDGDRRRVRTGHEIGPSPKGPVTITEQHGNRVGFEVRRREVGFAIPVQVPDRDASAIAPGVEGEKGRSEERTCRRSGEVREEQQQREGNGCGSRGCHINPH